LTNAQAFVFVRRISGTADVSCLGAWSSRTGDAHHSAGGTGGGRYDDVLVIVLDRVGRR
jgi:hypothetical protein